jgi:hypothetical protein
MKMNRQTSMPIWLRDTIIPSKNSLKCDPWPIAVFGVLLTAILTTPAFARPGSEYFCIFKRENSSRQVVDAYPTTDRSEAWACNQAQRQCSRDLREGQNCSKHSSGSFGYVQSLLCESIKGVWKQCNLLGKAVGDARLVSKYSQGPCELGPNWNLTPDGKSLWVDKGCRGVFEVETDYYQEPGVPPRIEARDDPR